MVFYFVFFLGGFFDCLTGGLDEIGWWWLWCSLMCF